MSSTISQKIELTGEASYKNALANIVAKNKELASELKSVQSSANSQSSALETMTKQIENQRKYVELLTTKYDAQKKSVASLEKELEQAKDEYGEGSEEVQKLTDKLTKADTELSKQKTSINNAETALNNMEAALEDAGDATDDLTDAIDDSAEAAEDASDGYSVMKNVLANLATSAISTAINALKQLAQAIADVTAHAVENYAAYEQLVGGIETLFGESADQMLAYAETAYKSAQLSANEYMETATSFAAALISGLGGDTASAVELTNLAITDMADNANKMGTDIESIQNAYKGFAKQTYTMLDNLKLGYGGTASEMVRLINDSGILNETISSLDDITFDQIILAIHAVQEQLGIAGTTAAEAATTIQGSWTAIQALFENILTKIGAQLAPMIMEVLAAVLEWMDGVDWDAFAEKIGAALDPILEFIQNVDFATFFDGLLEGAEKIIEVAAGVIDGLAGIIEFCGTLQEAFAAVAEYCATEFGPLIDAIGLLLVGLVELCEGIFTGDWSLIWQGVADTVKGAWDTICEVVNWLGGILLDLIFGIFGTSWSEVKEKMSNIWETIKTKWTDIVDGVKGWLGNIWDNVKSVFAGILDTIGLTDLFGVVQGIFEDPIGFITSLPLKALQWGADIINNIAQGIRNAISAVTSAVSSVASKIKSILGFSEPDEGPLSDFSTYMPDMLKLMARGIDQNAYRVEDAVEDLASTMNADLNGALQAHTSLTTETKVDAADLSSQLGILTTKIDELSEVYGSMSVYLDSGELVGATATKMDAALGKIQTSTARGQR